MARQNPSGRLRCPPAPLLALRATSPGTGESVFDKEGFSAPTLNFTSNFTLAKSGKVCYNLIAYRFSGKYSRNPNQKKGEFRPMSERLWGILVDSFGKILLPGLTVTIPLTAISFTLALIIAVAVPFKVGGLLSVIKR